MEMLPSDVSLSLALIFVFVLSDEEVFVLLMSIVLLSISVPVAIEKPSGSVDGRMYCVMVVYLHLVLVLSGR